MTLREHLTNLSIVLVVLLCYFAIAQEVGVTRRRALTAAPGDPNNNASVFFVVAGNSWNALPRLTDDAVRRRGGARPAARPP